MYDLKTQLNQAIQPFDPMACPVIELRQFAVARNPGSRLWAAVIVLIGIAITWDPGHLLGCPPQPPVQVVERLDPSLEV